MTLSAKSKILKRKRRHAKVRFKVSGTSLRPRLALYRSNRYLHAQLIDDEKGATLVGVFSKNEEGKNKMENAIAAGKKMAIEGQKKNIRKVVFDRGGFGFSGRIKAFAEGARAGGLEF